MHSKMFLPDLCRQRQTQWRLVRSKWRWHQAFSGCSGSSRCPVTQVQKVPVLKLIICIWICKFPAPPQVTRSHELFSFETFDVRDDIFAYFGLGNDGKCGQRWGIKGWLTSPYWLTDAPTQELMLLMSEFGPTMRAVPVSMMAWQPPEQATVCPLILTLKQECKSKCLFINKHLGVV